MLLAVVEYPTHKLPGGKQHADGLSPSQMVHDDKAFKEGMEVARGKMGEVESGKHQGSQGCS